jgi:hypothetical protein
MYTLLVARIEEDSLYQWVRILQLLACHAQDNSVASRIMGLRVATATSKVTATWCSWIVLRA